MINLNHAVKFQHMFWQDQLPKANTIIDATLGNGQDFLFLAQHAAPSAKLWGLDIQPVALEKSEALLAKQLNRKDVDMQFLLGSHDTLLKTIELPSTGIDLLIFNLGYLPGGNHELMTHSDTTIKAIEAGLEKLNKDGLITIVAYPGTAEGQTECERVKEFLTSLPQRQYDVSTWAPVNQINNPPVLFIIKGR